MCTYMHVCRDGQIHTVCMYMYIRFKYICILNSILYTDKFQFQFCITLIELIWGWNTSLSPFLHPMISANMNHIFQISVLPRTTAHTSLLNAHDLPKLSDEPGCILGCLTPCRGSQTLGCGLPLPQNLPNVSNGLRVLHVIESAPSPGDEWRPQRPVLNSPAQQQEAPAYACFDANPSHG